MTEHIDTSPYQSTRPKKITYSRSRTDAVGGRVSIYVHMPGRFALSALLAYLEEKAPGIPLDQVGVNFGTLQWVEDATPEELAAWEESDRHHAERKEKWERETLVRLKAKYEGE